MEQITPEQAIQEIQTYMHSDCYLDTPSNDACKLAISALEKQVPKKPVKKYCGRYTYYEQCPNCREPLPDAECCEVCGQAIDWSE